MTRGWRY